MNAVMKLDSVKLIESPRLWVSERPVFLAPEQLKGVHRFHKSIPGYARTPLCEWGSYAEKHGVRSILVKDESKRFGLRAFKGLGGSYAIFRVVCEELGLDPLETTLGDLKSERYREAVSKMTFITTTDGNHGKGVAWASGLLGCKSYVYMPRGSVEARAQAIRDAGQAEVTITDLPYDDCVRYTAELAETNHWYLVQDTSWAGYEKIPQWIIQGYTTMLYEALEQMREKGYSRPTHVFLQAGVGAMAGSMLGALCNIFKEDLPVVSIVEPEEVACIFESARQGDGREHKATGSEITIMAGLNCAEPCTVTWPILRDFASYYFACADKVAAQGMRKYAAPEEGDPKVISGESGAVTMGLLSRLLEEEAMEPIREKLGLNEDAVILLFNTEGDTDPENYQRIVSGKGLL